MVPSLYNWPTAEFLYDDLITRWRKPKFVLTDNGSEYAGNFMRLCKALGIIHWKITLGNKKAKGKAERVIWVIKECIR